MLEFPQPTKETYQSVFLEDTDRPLPTKLDNRTRYVLFKTIAKGGKSLIKSCKDMHLSRFVCYKTLRPEFADDATEQQRFLREARVSAMLQHPNTVPTYELGRDQRGHYYFTMKLVHGYTLREIFDYRERYDLSQLVDVLVQVAQALVYAHSHGVVHRDVKPENILVGPYGEVLLLDWGLAKVWGEGGSPSELAESADGAQSDSSITNRGKLQGTVSYMSPEQIRRDVDIDHRSDIYSLGAILYEILADTTPSKGERVDAIVASTLNDTPEKPSLLTNAVVPPLLEQLTMDCLAKSAMDRPADMGAVIRLLQEDWRSTQLRR